MSPSTIDIGGVVIREMTVTDRDDWAEMYSKLYSDGSRTGMLSEVDRILDSPLRAGYCAEIQGRKIGFAEYNVREFANGCVSKPVPFLEGIWVNPEFREQGVARALFSHLERVAKDAGYNEMGSGVLIENQLSIDVHKRFGFEETERVIYFRKDL